MLLPEVLAEMGVKREELESTRAAEVGNIFTLKYKYSDPLELKYQTEAGEQKTVFMGSYGIGISRVFGVIVEKFADDKGIVLPEAVAPYKYYFVANGEKGTAKAEELYNKFVQKDEILLDDRDLRFGEKMKDAELIGIPYRVVISDRGIEEGQVEITERKSGKTYTMTLAEFEQSL